MTGPPGSRRSQFVTASPTAPENRGWDRLHEKDDFPIAVRLGRDEPDMWWIEQDVQEGEPGCEILYFHAPCPLPESKTRMA